MTRDYALSGEILDLDNNIFVCGILPEFAGLSMGYMNASLSLDEMMKLAKPHRTTFTVESKPVYRRLPLPFPSFCRVETRSSLPACNMLRARFTRLDFPIINTSRL